MGYQVDDLTIDLTPRRVSRAGTVIALKALSFDLLVALVRAAPDVVSFEQLSERVWPGLVVSPETIVQRVKLLRDSLGDDPRTPRYVEGVRGRGYRMIAEVSALTERQGTAESVGPPSLNAIAATEAVGVSSPVKGVAIAATAAAAILVAIGYALQREAVTRANGAANPTAVPAPTASSRNVGAPVAASLSATNSIVVLPFVDMSEKKDQEYFSDGLSEELIELLGKTPGLRVIPRTSSFYFKGKSETLETIAAQLRVANVLEGSVRKSGNRLRITAQLIRADTSQHLWSETYERELRDVFQVQDEIAGAVVSALQVKLAAAPQAPYQRRTSTLEAYNQYLRGRQLFLKQATVDGFRGAAAAFRRAVELDPHYAAAYAELAVAESFVADQEADTAGQLRALAAVDKAVELAPDEAEPYATRGYMRVRRTWDWNGAEADFDKALALDAGNSDILSQYAGLLSSVGRLPEAVAAAKKATELDPFSSWAWATLSLYLVESAQFEEAHQALQRLIEVLPEAQFPLHWLGILQLREGKPVEALATFQSLSEEGLRLSGVAMAQYTLGHARESQQALDRIVATGAGERAGAFGLAEIYAWRGEKDQAFKWLDRAYQQRDSNLSDFRNDATLVSLHGDPRFAALLKKMNLPE